MHRFAHFILSHGSLTLFFLIYFNWRLVALQYRGGFCHTFTCISQGYTCVPHPEPSSHLPPRPIPQGHPSAPALSTLSHASNLDWQSISHMVIYVSMLVSQITPPLPSSTESTPVSLLLSHIQGHRYHLSKFHIYVLVYCIGVFLSDLLHSV